MTLKFSRSMLFAAALATVPAPIVAAAQTAAAPSRNQISIVARDQPIAAFLRDLFGRAGRPVVPSSRLTGTVNGVFQGTVEKIYGDIAKAFNLVTYYDGAAVYVYTSPELGVQTLQLAQPVAERVVRQAQAKRLPDARNLLRVTSDGLVVSGTPRFIEQVTTLAKGSTGGDLAGGTDPAPRGGGFGRGYGDVPRAPTSQPLEFRVFYLRYARAEDTLVTAGGRETRVPGLATILQNLVLDQKPGGSAVGSPLGARLVRQSQPRLKGQGLDAVAPDAAQTPIGGNYANTDVLGGGYPGEVMAPLSQDIVRIEPSAYLNAIIVRDVPERMAAYDSLIRALDVEPQLVEVEATIIDINVDKLRRLGINWRLGSGGFGALFGSGDAAADGRLSRIPGSRRTNVDNITPSGQGGTISTIIGSQREFIARVTALEDKGAARIVSRPQVMTLSNVEAVFDRTRTFYVRVAGREEVDLFNVTAGTVLRVNPHVFRDHDQTRIRVLVNIEDGNISPTSAVENIPIVDRSSVATQGMVLDGESLLLGGMITDADVNNEYKVPLLGDIPLLGELFKFREKQKGHTERLFLITPRLVPLASRAGPALPGGGLPGAADPGAKIPLPPKTSESRSR